ncbi:MAG TPA: hypothetical protein VGK19_14665 [Capsulimonadaceae bacterium]|jgi:hypothetical protein
MASPAVVELKFKEGERVKISEREPGTPDPKVLTFYPFYANLTGKVIKAYPDNTIAIDIDRGSLPEPIRLRHEASEQVMRDKWLGSLGEEERERLSEKHKNFSLRYTLLVSANDAEVDDGPIPRIKRSKPPVDEAQAAIARKTEADLESAEEAHLREIAAKKLQ